MKNLRRIIYLAILAVIIANLPFFDFLTQESYSYTNTDGRFYYVETGDGSNDFEACKRRYNHFLSQHPEEVKVKDRLYRSFTIKPWRFWEWRQMIFEHERFSLPYKALVLPT